MIRDSRARAALVARIPELRAFAVTLCGNRDQGDDLVQDTLLSAWAHLEDFQDGTNMGAWLFTISRNRFVNLWRKRRSRGDITVSAAVDQISTVPEQEGWAIREDLHFALRRLPIHQREAVILVGAAGLTIEEAASACKCEVGTIKSRVSRARARLAQLMSDDLPDAPENRRPAHGRRTRMSSMASARTSHAPVA